MQDWLRYHCPNWTALLWFLFCLTLYYYFVLFHQTDFFFSQTSIIIVDMSVNGGPVWDRYRPPGSDTNPSRIDIYGTYPRKSHAVSLLRNSPYSANNVRGILRNKREYSPVNQTMPIYDAAPLNETLEDSLDTQPLKPQPLLRFPDVKKCLENCIRPAVAELFSMLMAVFVVTFAENQLFMFAIHRVFRIGIVAVLEAAMFSTFFAMFSKHERYI